RPVFSPLWTAEPQSNRRLRRTPVGCKAGPVAVSWRIRIFPSATRDIHPMSNYLFTSESVSEGHPDKVADQISDAVLDAVIAKDPAAHVACETMVKTGVAIVAGEIT